MVFSLTTGRALFAEGPKPSAKAQKPSAKPLPRAALGKAFAEGGPRQRALGEFLDGKNGL